MREGVVAVPGARLHYRIAGRDPGSQPILVFENGWGASLHMWSWVQRELEDHASLLFYSRAGIGRSELRAPQAVPRMSDQLAALLDALEVRQPVVTVGQSYGGLLCSAHAVQIPDRVHGLVQVDPAVERADPVVDRALTAVPAMTRIVALLARLRLPDPLLSPSTGDLPEPDGAELRCSAFRSPRSLRAARAELALLPTLRETAVRPAAQPRFVLSAGRAVEPASALGRRLTPAHYARAVVERAASLNRATATRGSGSRWQELPHTHGGLVFTRQGAVDTAARILEFVRSPPFT
jgi:pimeloyl-ACP methyl ester carboxylesterase